MLSRLDATCIVLASLDFDVDDKGFIVKPVSPVQNERIGEMLSLGETQHIALGVLDELDRFCKEKEIPYYLIGGSLIGAVRSQDLVPWDDDIDVAMKRSDYERFCNEYTGGKQYQLFTYRSVENYRHGVAKLIDTSTLFVEPTTRDAQYGVFVDVFALDEIKSPDDPLVKRLARSIKVYEYAFVLAPFATKGSIMKSAIRIVLSKTLGLGSYRHALARIEKQMSEGRGGFLINHWGAWGKRECVSAKCFETSTSVMLRGKCYPAPIGYDAWLTSVYGDYMSPPKNPPHYHGHAYRLDAVDAATKTGGEDRCVE